LDSLGEVEGGNCLIMRRKTPNLKVLRRQVEQEKKKLREEEEKKRLARELKELRFRKTKTGKLISSIGKAGKKYSKPAARRKRAAAGDFGGGLLDYQI